MTAINKRLALLYWVTKQGEPISMVQAKWDLLLALKPEMKKVQQEGGTHLKIFFSSSPLNMTGLEQTLKI